MADNRRFIGEKYIYEDLGDGCQKWTPTADYRGWLERQYPRLSNEDMVRRHWISPHARKKKG